jgi:hypothetical protein
VKRIALLVVIAGALIWLYANIYQWIIGHVSLLVLSAANVSAAVKFGGLGLLKLMGFAIDLFVTLLVSVPFAYAIARLYRIAWLPVAIIVGGYLAAQDLLGIPTVWVHVQDHRQYLLNLAIGTARLLIVLPALTYLAWRLTSNNRLERSRAAAASVSRGEG